VSEPWLSADDIAAHLGVTKDTAYTWIAEKDMPAHKVGRLWKFQSAEVDDWGTPWRGGRGRHRQRLTMRIIDNVNELRNTLKPPKERDFIHRHPD